MILVAGLAVAGLVGIAAAFYFSIRPAKPGNKRAGAGYKRDLSVQPDRTSRTRPARYPANGRRPDHGRAAAARNYRTAPDPVRDHRGPERTRRLEPDDDRWAPMQAGLDGDKATRSRRRSGWLKRGDVDEELWPADAFGGVSDEQFWDDLASDKPLATTARTAQQDSGSRRRLPDAVPLPGADPAKDDRRARGGGGRRTGREDLDAHPEPRRGSAAPQPYQTGPQQAQTGPQHYQTGPQHYQTGPQPSYATGPQPSYASADRPETRRPPRGEDPLTSAAFSLRSSGPVDGRSYRASRRSRDLTREQYEAAVSQETQTFSLADTEAATCGYPDGVPPFRQFDSVPASGSERASGTAAYPYPGTSHTEQAQPMNTPPYGENYGYRRSEDRSRPGDGYRRSEDPSRPGGSGAGSRGTGPAYPQDAYRRGTYPQGAYSQGAYPQGNGQRGRYDPWDGNRR